MTTTHFVPAFNLDGVVVRACDIEGLLLLTPKRNEDERGFFSECYKRAWFHEIGIVGDFIQDNHSLSRARGVLRGLHFQAPPYAQGKLVRVLRGAIYDVAVDIRKGSPTYGRHAAIVLDANDGDQLWAPPGFAHGFATLHEDSEVLYKVTAPYAPNSEGGVAWDDPDLGIAWPIDAARATLSTRDKNWPRLTDLASPFEWIAAAASGREQRP